MPRPENGAMPCEDTGAERAEGFPIDNPLPLDLVSAIAGDRQLTEADRRLVDALKAARGGRFYADLLYTITHQHFPPDAAADLWGRILRHKYEMSAAMHRNIRIAVASLDYLSNLTAELVSATVIDEARIADIVRRAQCDGLTGLYNHACCYQQLHLALRRRARYGTPVSLMMVDVDDFKTINDRYGHQEGDRVLVVVGKTIEEATRDADICCRYGGEEFAVILPSTGAQEAGLLAERLRARVAEALSGDRAVTVSIGVAACGPDADTAQDLVRKADLALYQAKAAGKNRVMMAAAQVPA